MNLRALCLTLFAFSAVAAPANASVADHIIPLYDASDGVRAVQRSTGEVVLRFGPKAAKLYKSIAGKRAELSCGTVTGESESDGFFTTGHGSTQEMIPKRRGSVRMYEADKALELCSISTRRTKSDRTCFPAELDSTSCVRVIVAVKPSGRAYIESKARTIELSLTSLTVSLSETPGFTPPGGTRLERVQAMLGPDVVELATPEEAPPAGKVGYWFDGKNLAVAVLLADGTRSFVRMQDGVYSTNDMALVGLDNDEVFTLWG